MNSPHSPDLWLGRLIGDRQRYRLDLLLGQGGMGYVFLAMDTLLGQQVALKLLKETMIGSGELKQRFEREVALCAALKSDHIVQVTDYGVTLEGHPFYVMEYLNGQTLGQLMRREKKLSVEQTVGIISQVCEGLHLAHEGVTLWRDGATTSEHVKIVHRDLKPDNIFLVPKAQGVWVKILDFGVAKIRTDVAEHTNLTNMFIGTFHYAAPEQLGVAKDLDGRADIYSLGIILYEMLSGTDPFGLGLNINQISGMSWAIAHASKPVLPLRSQPNCKHLSPDLEAIVMRCLQKVPNERFAAIDQVNQALQAAFAIGSGANDMTIHQMYLPNQTTYQQSQQDLELSEDSCSIETKVTENYISNPRLPTDNPQPGKDKRKARQLLFKVITVVTAALVSMGLASYAYIQWQANQSAVENAKILKERLSQDEKWLAQAKKLAEKNNFQDAIAEASKIQPDSSLSVSAQSLVSQWSENLLKQAGELYKQSYNSQDLAKAVDITKAIPKTSSVAQNAEKTSQKWQIEWKNNEDYLKIAQNKLNEGKWQEALDKASKVKLLGQEVKPETPYWQKKMKPIIEGANELVAVNNSQKSGTNDAAKTERRPQPVRTQTTRRPVQAQTARRPVRTQTARRPVQAQTVRRPVRTQTTRRPVQAQTARRPVQAQPTGQSGGWIEERR